MPVLSGVLAHWRHSDSILELGTSQPQGREQFHFAPFSLASIRFSARSRGYRTGRCPHELLWRLPEWQLQSRGTCPSTKPEIAFACALPIDSSTRAGVRNTAWPRRDSPETVECT